MTAPDTARFAAALGWAADLHRGQLRKGTGDGVVVGVSCGAPVPYVAHVLAVASLVWEFGGDEDQAIAGLLHDVLEDVGPPRVDAATIEERFGARVRAIVEDCTDATDPTNKPPWHERKRAHLVRLGAARTDSLLVAGCDKLANVRSVLADHAVVGDAVWDRFNASAPDTCWYYAEVARVIAARLPGALADTLSEASDRLCAVVSGSPATVTSRR